MKRMLLTIKRFWNAVKPLLPDKVKSKEKVILVENNKIIMQYINIAE